MKKKNSSIFKRILAFVLCTVVLAGTASYLFNGVSFNEGANSGDSLEAGNNADKDPEKNPADDPVKDPTDDPIEDPGDPDGIFAASAALDQGALIYGSLASEVTLGGVDGMGAVIPADVKIAEGASSLSLLVKSTDAIADIPLNEGDIATSLDVHIDGVSNDNAVPMIVNLGSVFPAGIAKTGLKFYHIEDGVAKLMTRVNSADDFAIHNQYTYHALTGEVSIYVASFSVFTAVETTADEWDGNSDTTWYNENDTEFTLTTAEQLAGFRELVDDGKTFAGKIIKLGADINLERYKVDEEGNYILDEEGNKIKVSFDPIGFGYWNESKVDAESRVDSNTVFMGTFDGAGHTVYNLYQNGWDLGYSYSTAGGGLFASIKDATIKNLAINGAEIVMECIDMGTVVGYAQGTCHFENIVVTNSKLANYQRYTGGVVGEVSYGPYGTDVSKGYSHTFKNVTVDSSVKISSLWGDFDNACGGVIGGKLGDATVMMENVIVACEIDAFSDVTAAYQWYAYRRCGMLIGHTEQNSPKKALNAAAEFLTCENVNVYYGDWVNYTYYKYDNQTDAQGNRLWNSNYPWVRAEAGEHNGAFSNVRYGNPIVNGVAINTLELAEKHKTAYTSIVFNQLYGGGQGVYGCATHEGVTVSSKNTKTIYISNNLGWTNPKLDYWFVNGEDRWSTIVDPIVLIEENGVYRVDLPAFAFGFQITADDEKATREFYVFEVEESGTYNLDFAHNHKYIDRECVCGAYELASGKNADVVADPGKWYYFCDGTNGNQYQLASTPTYDDGTITFAFEKTDEDEEDKKRTYQLRYQPNFGVGTTYKVTFTVTVDAACKVVYGCGGENTTKELAEGETMTFTWTGVVSDSNPFSINLRSDDRSAPITMTVSNITMTETPAN